MNAIGARALRFRPAAALRQHTVGLTSTPVASSSRTLQLQQPAASLLFNNPHPQRRAYHEAVIDHFNNPRNVGKLDKKSKSVGSATVGKASCGDVIRLDIEVEKDEKTGQEVIKDAKFKTFGCGSAIASSSYATERVIGAGLKEAEGLKNTDISQHLSLPPVKIHCSVLAEEAIQAAIADYKRKQAEADGGGK